LALSCNYCYFGFDGFLITLLVTLNLVGNQAIGMVSEKVDMDLYFEVGSTQKEF